MKRRGKIRIKEKREKKWKRKKEKNRWNKRIKK